jgi:hypothetical protein
LVSRRPCEALTVLGSPFRVVIDSDGRVFRAFEIWQVPTVFVMDHRGMIVESAMGWEADAVVWKHMNQGGRE